MKLFKKERLSLGNYDSGHTVRNVGGFDDGEYVIQDATLSDLKAALKEHGMVAVPVEPTEDMVDAPWVALGDGKHSIREIYKAMTKAAEGRDNG